MFVCLILLKQQRIRRDRLAYHLIAEASVEDYCIGQFGEAVHVGSPAGKAAVSYNKSQSMQLSEMSRQRRY